MKAFTHILVGLSLFGLTLASAPQAEARGYAHSPVTVTVSAPRVVMPRVAPRVVVAPAPVHVVRPRVVVRPPHRTYVQIYRAGWGVPHQIYVDGYYDRYGRYFPGYWTWTY